MDYNDRLKLEQTCEKYKLFTDNTSQKSWINQVLSVGSNPYGGVCYDSVRPNYRGNVELMYSVQLQVMRLKRKAPDSPTSLTLVAPFIPMKEVVLTTSSFIGMEEVVLATSSFIPMKEVVLGPIPNPPESNYKITHIEQVFPFRENDWKV